MNTLAIAAQDPVRVAIDYLLTHGGFLSLLGVPAVLATIAFVYRIHYLRNNRQPHKYGRTNIIYWPTQIFISLACLSLIFLPFSQYPGDAPSLGLIPAAALTLVAWSTALVLNRNEHAYEVRSSDYLFVYFFVTIATSLLSLYILNDHALPLEGELPVITSFISAYHTLSAFTILIGTAFAIEAFPRSNTQVQIRAREEHQLSDYELANVFSRITFHYVQDIITLGASRTLTGTDIETTNLPHLHTKVNYDSVTASWDRAKAKAAQSGKTPSYFFAVLRAYRSKVALGITLRLMGFAVAFLPTMLFGQLLTFIRDYSDAVHGGSKIPPPIHTGLLIAAAMFLSNITASLLAAAALQINAELGQQSCAATVALIYAKALKLSNAARQRNTLGEITNYMAVDAEKMVQASIYMPFIVTIPFELGISMYLLYQLLGWSSFAGVAVIAIIAPIQVKMGAFLNDFSNTRLEYMDERIRLLTEILANIKIVRLYGWEDAFHSKVEAIRAKELVELKGLATIRSVLTIVFSSVTLLMTLATFSVYATVGGPNMTPGRITSEVVFVSITLLGVMSRPLGMITHMFSRTIGILVGCRRIQRFLLMEEIDSSVVQRYSRQVSSGNSTAVEIENGTFSWEKQADSTPSTETDDENQPLLSAAATPTIYTPTLNNINVRITDGSLTAVVGRIGQGKSSLLGAIMGEMYKLQGTVKVYGDIAYVPQQAWIINATLKDNILFGKPFDQEKYDSIIYASGLVPDFAMLPAGDQTEIGERGINLSGGQKQRVSLARAAYQDADVYLLDDPLSAVDAHVDQHLWDNLVGPNGLLCNKTRILVTHGIHHLEHVDQILVFKDGSISEAGHYKELMDANGAFHQLIKEYSVGQNKKARHDKIKTKVGEESDSADDSVCNTIVATEEAGKKDDDVKDDDANGELVTDEKMAAGNVSWKIWMVYARAVSLRKATFCIAIYIIGRGVHISTSLWLRKWINDTEDNERTGTTLHPVSFYLLSYGGLVLVYMFFDVLINYISEVICGIQASTVLFNGLLNCIFRLPMSFFDTTPMGRIVNRFSSDIDAIDDRLPEEFNDFFAFTSMIGGALFLIAYSTPAFLIMIPPLGMVYFFIQNYFIKCSASLKRLYSVSKSPLYQHFSESLSGVSSIRAMRGLQAQFLAQNQARADVVSNRTYVYNLANRWLQVRIEILGSLTVFISASLSVLKAGELDPTLVAVALSYSITMQVYINLLIRIVNEVQNDLVSVERVQEYSEKPIEAPAVTGVPLPESWPQQGRVVFKNYSARYREGLDLVIKDASFEVQPAEKIGIVGRTGAGKSSLTLALFRIIEAADSYWAIASDPSMEGKQVDFDMLHSGNGEGGSIEIDGVDISTLGLRDLRRHLAIIPQDPTLFAGTLRENLDPFNETSDADLWEALERAHLKSHISSLAGGLSYEVAQNGENFSIGQRSLICLARALLRKTKVLILDEATAAVDVETDDLIQKTIRKEFKDRTVLTIAHRIKTVMDSDKILVLEKGRVQEYESPSELLKKKGSLFYKLAKKAGEV
ncbi:hypothetical protein MVEG_11735 [Podila verticillata NRRL 6337]|uniref:P-loop containing nucleoside triphosphate hydrolase protein n=1 Tax=Podila verticillata NRRL 6337 TaxID=1069443 RepID=A0A086TJG9_9FUNG|nr:hypothetical protein MVEG_11735 [Podila verticillata NRRL 6337]